MKKLEELNEDSTPCEICEALGLTDRRISKYPDDIIICYATGSYCLQKDRALIKLLYLNYINSKKSEVK